MVISLLQARVNEHPTKDAVHYLDDRRCSIGKLNVHARGLGAGLRLLRHGNQDTVLACLPNNLERIVLQLACLYSGTKLAVTEKYVFEEFDMFKLLDASKPKSLFVTSNLVRKVRAAVPELTPAGFDLENMAHPRNHVGSMNDGLPISSLDFPQLKHCFHTGSGREGKFSRYRDLLVYYPTQDPLEDTEYKPLDADDNFITMLSLQGKVQKQMSINQLVNEAIRVKKELKLGADEAVFLATGGDPVSTLVSVLACIEARSQCIVPGNATPAVVTKALEVERITCAVGNSSVPGNLQRVAAF